MERRSSDEALVGLSQDIGRLQAQAEANAHLAKRDRDELRHDMKNVLAAMQAFSAIPERVRTLEESVETLELSAKFLEKIKQNGKGAIIVLLFGGAIAVEGVHKGMDTIIGWVTK